MFKAPFFIGIENKVREDLPQRTLEEGPSVRRALLLMMWKTTENKVVAKIARRKEKLGWSTIFHRVVRMLERKLRRDRAFEC